MKVAEVKKLKTPEDVFWYFVNERHRVYLDKTAGAPKPWTDDEVLQRYKFTNIFRELDKDTGWCKRNIRDPLDDPKTYDLLLFNVALFRQTGGTDGWQGIVRRWDAKAHAAKYVAAQSVGKKVFTGAYMVTGKFPDAKGRPKVETLFQHALQPVWDDRKKLVELCLRTKSLEALTEALSQYIGWRGNKFMAYEVACDLLHTSLLRGAVDQYTWANPGPGAQRGLSRIHGGAINMGRGASSRPRAQCVKEMQELLAKAPKMVGKHILNFTHDGVTGPMLLDMRMCEHVLCEFDKQMRVLHGEGFPKGRYNGHQS
jgi:hypothetical protein